MKRFKMIDFWMSVTLIILSIAFAFCKTEAGFFAGYFAVGGWQVISILVHYYKNWFCEKHTNRRHYQSAVIIIFLIAALGFVFNIILFVLLYILVFAAPFMAVYYTYLCYKETYVKMQRPLALLK